MVRKGVRLVSSDPVVDTTCSLLDSPSAECGAHVPAMRRHSFDAGVLMEEQRENDPQRRNSCILDYALRLSPAKKAFHNRSMSDNTAESSSCSVIPSNYRYSIKDFQFVKAVNSGSFGKICLVRMVSTGELYAMKIINSEEAVASNREEYVESEWNVFRQVNSEHIVRCFYTFYYAKYLCFVMEYLNGGDLSFFLQEYALFEKEARIYLAEIVLALEYLHSKGIIHRDVKPANVLIGADGHTKLSDFGLSMCTYATDPMKYSYRSPLLTRRAPEPKLPKKVGTAYYMAPEVISDNVITPDADWWALGVLAYEMLTGKLPFTGDTVEEIFDSICSGNMQKYGVGKGEDCVSEEADSFFRKTLTPDRGKRLGHNGAEEVKRHPFFRGINWATIRSEKAPFVPIVKPDNPTLYFPENKGFSLEEYIKLKDDKTKPKDSNEKERVTKWGSDLSRS